MEKRWENNLSFVTCPPWNSNKEHDGDAEVFLDEKPLERSFQPSVSPLPPTTMEEPVSKVRSFYVKPKNVDPATGIGFIQGALGARQ